LDAKPERPSIGEIFDDYWELLPRYQGVDVENLELLRILYGYFPTYRQSPLATPFNRILAVGDASGIQSPLSFGGFGSLTRHISRITNALDEATRYNLIAAKDLSLINAYQPSLSIAWMFQLAMSVRVNTKPMSDTVIVDTLSNTFRSMSKLGDETLMPFLQDVLMFNPLFRTLLGAAGQDLLTPI
jgi:lycopene cyclase CruP